MLARGEDRVLALRGADPAVVAVAGVDGRLVRQREDAESRLGDWLTETSADIDRAIQGAVERVFKTLDLPRRSDIEALNDNLQRVADALESLERWDDMAPDPNADAARDDAPR